MSINNISLDINYVKKQFPAFQDPLSSKWSFFENAGGIESQRKTEISDS